MGELLVIALFEVAMALIGIAIASWLLHHFVALTAPPTRRATWTVAIASLTVAILEGFSEPEGYWWAAPLAVIPAGALALWWWRRDFQQSWIDDSQPLPEGVELANDDWPIGLIFVASVIAIVVVKVLWKLAVRGQL